MPALRRAATRYDGHAVRRSWAAPMHCLRIYRRDENVAEELQQRAIHRHRSAAFLGYPRRGFYLLGLGKIQMPPLRQGRRECPRLIARITRFGNIRLNSHP